MEKFLGSAYLQRKKRWDSEGHTGTSTMNIPFFFLTWQVATWGLTALSYSLPSLYFTNISIQHKTEQQQQTDCNLLIFLTKLPFLRHSLSLMIGSISHWAKLEPRNHPLHFPFSCSLPTSIPLANGSVPSLFLKFVYSPIIFPTTLVKAIILCLDNPKSFLTGNPFNVPS